MSHSTRSSQASLPALKQNQTHNHQLTHPSMGQGKFVIDDVITSQGTIKRDVMRNSESVQAVRQESIMLAEKVQHATNLYRQLAARVGKTEERFDMEQKSMGNILGQAKQIEMQLIQQQEQLVSKDGQLALQVHKLQEEVIMLKNEREQYRKQMNSLQQEVRTIADKITRQSGALSNGLQDLKSYLDQKDIEKNQELTTSFNAMQSKLDAIEHRTTISQAQTEGRCEKLNLQISQNEKQRQEDIYQISTSMREKEAICKADVRRLDERVKNMFEDMGKGTRSSEGKLKNDFDVKFIELERKMAFEQKDGARRISELEDEISTKMSELTESSREEMANFASDIQEQIESSQGVDELRKEVKHVDKSLRNHRKDIEKVVRAEIASRVTQGEKLNQVLGELKKDHVESFSFLESTFGDHKRKHDEAMELAKKDLTRYVNETIKANKCSYDETRVIDLEKKLDEMEDALEELAKQEERIGMNSEQLKQIEMENILAQGDMNLSIDANAKDISAMKSTVEETKKNLKAFTDKKPRPPTALKKLEEQTNDLDKNYQILPSKIKLVEKKLMFLAEAFEIYKSENRNNSNNSRENIQTRKDTPAGRPASKASSPSYEKMSLAMEKMASILTLIKDILKLNLIESDPEQEMNKNKQLLKEVEKEFEELFNIRTDSDGEDDEDNGDDKDEEEEDDNGDSDEKDDNDHEDDDSDDKEEGEENKNEEDKEHRKENEKNKDKVKLTDEDKESTEEDEDDNSNKKTGSDEKEDKKDEEKDKEKEESEEDSDEDVDDEDWSDDEEEEEDDDDEDEDDEVKEKDPDKEEESEADEEEEPESENSKERNGKTKDKDKMNAAENGGSAKKRDKNKSKDKGTKQ